MTWSTRLACFVMGERQGVSPPSSGKRCLGGLTPRRSPDLRTVYFTASFAPRYADNCVDFDLSAAAKWTFAASFWPATNLR